MLENPVDRGEQPYSQKDILDVISSFLPGTPVEVLPPIDQIDDGLNQVQEWFKDNYSIDQTGVSREVWNRTNSQTDRIVGLMALSYALSKSRIKNGLDAEGQRTEKWLRGLQAIVSQTVSQLPVELRDRMISSDIDAIVLDEVLQELQASGVTDPQQLTILIHKYYDDSLRAGMQGWREHILSTVPPGAGVRPMPNSTPTATPPLPQSTINVAPVASNETDQLLDVISNGSDTEKRVTRLKLARLFLDNGQLEEAEEAIGKNLNEGYYTRECLELALQIYTASGDTDSIDTINQILASAARTTTPPPVPPPSPPPPRPSAPQPSPRSEDIEIRDQRLIALHGNQAERQQARTRLVTLYVQAGRNLDAIQTLEEQLRVGDASIGNLYELARLNREVGQGQPDEASRNRVADQLERQARERIAAERATPTEPDPFTEIDQLETVGDYEDALHQLHWYRREQAINGSFYDIRVMERYIRLFRLKGDDAMARSLAETMRSLEELIYPPSIEYQIGEWEEFLKSPRSPDEHAAARSILAKELLNKGQWRQALDLINKNMAEDYVTTSQLQMLADIYQNHGGQTQAAEINRRIAQRQARVRRRYTGFLGLSQAPEEYQMPEKTREQMNQQVAYIQKVAKLLDKGSGFVPTDAVITGLVEALSKMTDLRDNIATASGQVADSVAIPLLMGTTTKVVDDHRVFELNEIGIPENFQDVDVDSRGRASVNRQFSVRFAELIQNSSQEVGQIIISPQGGINDYNQRLDTFRSETRGLLAARQFSIAEHLGTITSSLHAVENRLLVDVRISSVNANEITMVVAANTKYGIQQKTYLIDLTTRTSGFLGENFYPAPKLFEPDEMVAIQRDINQFIELKLEMAYSRNKERQRRIDSKDDSPRVLQFGV